MEMLVVARVLVVVVGSEVVIEEERFKLDNRNFCLFPFFLFFLLRLFLVLPRTTLLLFLIDLRLFVGINEVGGDKLIGLPFPFIPLLLVVGKRETDGFVVLGVPLPLLPVVGINEIEGDSVVFGLPLPLLPVVGIDEIDGDEVVFVLPLPLLLVVGIAVTDGFVVGMSETDGTKEIVGALVVFLLLLLFLVGDLVDLLFLLDDVGIFVGNMVVVANVVKEGITVSIATPVGVLVVVVVIEVL